MIRTVRRKLRQALTRWDKMRRTKQVTPERAAERKLVLVRCQYMIEAKK